MSDYKWLDEVESRCAAATEGPWDAKNGALVVVEPPPYGSNAYHGSLAVSQRRGTPIGGLIPHGILYRTDAEFIAHSRTDLPRAAAWMRRAAALVEDFDCGCIECADEGCATARALLRELRDGGGA